MTLLRRPDYRATLRFDRIELVALQAWVRHRGPWEGRLVVAVHVDRVGRRPLEADEIARIVGERTRPARVHDDDELVGVA